MRAIISKDEDAKRLLLSLEVKEQELANRFREQGRDGATTMRETMRAVHYVVIEWLQEQGFKS